MPMEMITRENAYYMLLFVLAIGASFVLYHLSEIQRRIQQLELAAADLIFSGHRENPASFARGG